MSFDKRKRCKDCKHYMQFTYDIDDDEIEASYGECRRYPPKLVASEERGFPIVEEDCWCGEFDMQ